MRTILYDQSDKCHADVGKKLKELPKRENGYVLVIKENRPIRSLKANRFYWVVIRIYAIHTGHTEKEIDNMFRMARHFEVVIYPNGKQQLIPKDTHDCDTKEFAAVINNLLQWGREEFPEVIVPRQEDTTYMQLMAIDNEYNKTFDGW